MWIRIRIRGSMPLTNGSGSCYFRHWPSRDQQKTNFLYIFSAYYFLKVIYSPKKSQNSRNQGFSYYFNLMIKGTGSGLMDPVPRGPKTCATGGSGSGTLLKRGAISLYLCGWGICIAALPRTESMLWKVLRLSRVIWRIFTTSAVRSLRSVSEEPNNVFMLRRKVG